MDGLDTPLEVDTKIANALLGLATEAFVAAQLACRDASIAALQGAKADATLLALYRALGQQDHAPERNPHRSAQDAETTSAITAALLAYYTSAQGDALLEDYRTASAQNTEGRHRGRAGRTAKIGLEPGAGLVRPGADLVRPGAGLVRACAGLYRERWSWELAGR